MKMTALKALVKRNIKLFFNDKGLFFTSLITPVILLVLYVTFLAKVYRDSFASALPDGMTVSEELINGCVGGQLVSSLLAVCCVTVAFCSNMLMVQDKANGSRGDLTATPVSCSALALGYYISAFLSTLVISLFAAAAGMAYMAWVGWYMSAADVLLVLLDVVLLVMFGTAVSSVVNFFLSTQGQISAVGTVVSSGYGFISGAYMPISSFSDGLQKGISMLPGTYGTSLLRNHAMRGIFEEMTAVGFPDEVVRGIRDSVDCNLYFFDKPVGIGAMYCVLIGATALFIGAYVALNRIRARKKR